MGPASLLVLALVVVGAHGAPQRVQVTPRLSITACADNILRIRFNTTDDTSTASSLIITTDWPDAPTPTVTHSGSTVTVATAAVQAVVDVESEQVVFYRLDRTTNSQTRVLAEAHRSVTPVSDMGQARVAVEQGWQRQPGEAIYGLGEYQDGLLNWDNVAVRLVQFNPEAIVPFLTSSKGYGILWDQYSESHLNKPDATDEIVFSPTPSSSPPLAQASPEAAAAAQGSSTLQATFTPKASGAHCFQLLFTPGLWPSWEDASAALLLNGAVLFQWDDANLPNTMSARATLTAGVAYNLTLTVSGGKGAPRVFVLSPARPANVLRSELASELDYYFIDGGEQGVDGAVAGYRQATGAATLPPKAVLGFTQCKERYHNQSELLQSAHTFRRLEIPVDFIVQDWHYWGPDCNWAPDWNPGQYPDPKGMVAELHSMNYTFMVSVWSKFGDCSAAYKIMSDKGFLINGTPYYDPYNSAAREQFYQLAKAAMFDIGVDALWLDATEPEGLVNINHSVALGSGNYFLNPYALETTRAISEGVVRDYSMRVFSLTRSSFAGMHRNGAVLWSGDISGTWAMLQRQVAASINYALSGEPYWACDTGGFFRPANQYTDPGYHELLIRWFQFSLFTPLYRVHGAGSNTELWNYGNDTMATIVRGHHLRYRLLPYLYSLAHMVTLEGYTIQRGLAFEFAGDPGALEVADQFLCGPALMIAPMIQPGRNRSVYWPAGAKFVDFWTGAAAGAAGSRTVVPAPLDSGPIFARQGSLLLLGPFLQSTKEKPADPLEVRIYRGSDASFVLYEDDGVTRGGPVASIAFSWSETAATLTIGKRGGAAFPGMLASRTINIVAVREGHGAGLSPTAAPDKSITYTGQEVRVALQ